MQRQAYAVAGESQRGIEALRGFPVLVAGKRQFVAAPTARALHGPADQFAAYALAAGVAVDHHVFENRRAGEIVRQVFDQMQGAGAEQALAALGHQGDPVAARSLQLDGQQRRVRARIGATELL